MARGRSSAVSASSRTTLSEKLNTEQQERSRGFKGCWQGIDISGSGLIAGLLLTIAIACAAGAMASVAWAKAEPDADFVASVKMGLFKYCAGRRCQNYVDNSFPPAANNDLNLVSRTEASAAFLGIAILLCFCSIVQIIFGLGRTGYHRTIWRSSVFCFYAACSSFLAMVIFGATLGQLPSRFSAGASFHVNIVCCVFCVISGVLLHIDSKNITYLDPEQAARQGGKGMI
eukprot:m.359049 g.359049  ORF g.359049 m.359049 type:complete len:230 (+) comp18384_c0_seq1:178-867(+)